MKVAVVGVQGAVSEHLEAIARLGATPVWARKPSDLKSAGAVIIPGGESTTISRLMVESKLFEAVKRMGVEGVPVWGTCAGLVLLAKKGCAQVEKTGQRLLALMDMEAERNAFGRQKESFEAQLEVEGIGLFPCVFIRAPAIVKTWGKCRPLARFGKFTVAARQESLLATSFHPELSGDDRFHEYFLDFAR